MITVQSEKVTAQHQERQACIYIRQSTPRQVRENRESQENPGTRLRVSLVERAVALGWPRDQIQVIDDDLGQSGRSSQRPGFQTRVSAGSLGHVGLILAYQASRLARNNTDWYILLDLAALRGTTWTVHESGHFQAEDTVLTKRGNPSLRYTLTEAANSVRIQCPEYSTYYQAQDAESPTHAHKRALVLTARKLVRLVDVLLRTDTIYRPPENWKTRKELTRPHPTRPAKHHRARPVPATR